MSLSKLSQGSIFLQAFQLQLGDIFPEKPSEFSKHNGLNFFFNYDFMNIKRLGWYFMTSLLKTFQLSCLPICLLFSFKCINNTQCQWVENKMSATQTKWFCIWQMLWRQVPSSNYNVCATDRTGKLWPTQGIRPRRWMKGSSNLACGFLSKKTTAVVQKKEALYLILTKAPFSQRSHTLGPPSNRNTFPVSTVAS